MATEIRKRNNDSIRMQYRANADENRRLIRENSDLSFMENSTKVKKVQDCKKLKLKGQEESTDFENRFMRKGNLSIQNSVRQFEK